jgi:SAM-dependent methyltransferase
MPHPDIEQIDRRTWASGDYVRDYANRILRPVEVVLLARYSRALSGRTLELGCGAGRVLGYMAQIADEAHGVDLSVRMVDYCRHAYPRAHVTQGDLADATSYGSGAFDMIWLGDNVIDVLGDAERRGVLSALRERLAQEGVLVFSSHNLDAVEPPAAGSAAAGGNHRGASQSAQLIHRLGTLTLAKGISRLRRTPARYRNRRRLAPLAYRGDRYAILNDEAHDYSLLHYYTRRDVQEDQLRELGYTLLECLDKEGEPVARGQLSSDTELHYVAQANSAE